MPFSAIFKRIAWFIALVVTTIFFYRVTHRTLYVSPAGNDAYPGTKDQPLKSITSAFQKIGLGGTIYVLPGIYREEIVLARSPLALGFIRIQGLSSASDHAIIVGSEPASSVAWTRCSAVICPGIVPAIRNNVFVSKWGGSRNPNILTETAHAGTQHQFVLARAPNEYHPNPDKYHEFWWTADGTNASSTQLVDTTDEPNLLPGNITTSPTLVGATAIIIDGNKRCGNYLYERRIVTDDVSHGNVTFDSPVGALTYGIQENGIGPYTKYYVENAIGLLDTPGEWFYDDHTGMLYVWPFDKTNPSLGSIEVGERDTGIRINASNVTVDNLTIETINDEKENNVTDSGAVVIGSTPNMTINAVTLSHLFIQNVGNGITIRPPDSNHIRHISILHADIGQTSKSAIYVEASSHPPTNTMGILISDSSIHNAATRYNEPGINIVRASNVRIVDNHIFDNASYGIHVTAYEDTPGIVKNIVLTDNHVEHVCQNESGCAAIKMFGGKFSNTVVNHNLLENNLGWSYCYDKLSHNNGNADGLFISNASGITVTNNAALNNSQYGFTVYPRQFATTHNVFYGNSAIHSRIGLKLDTALGEIDNNPNAYATRHDNTVITHNLFSGNDIGISLDPANPKNIVLNGNRYENNATDMVYKDLPLGTTKDIRNLFPFWETQRGDL